MCVCLDLTLDQQKTYKDLKFHTSKTIFFIFQKRDPDGYSPKKAAVSSGFYLLDCLAYNLIIIATHVVIKEYLTSTRHLYFFIL